MVDFVQDVVGKKKLIAQFEDGHNKYMSASLLWYICSKNYVDQDVDDITSDLRNKGGQAEFFTFDEDPVVGGNIMFE